MSESFADKAKRAAGRALDEAERRYAASGSRDVPVDGDVPGSRDVPGDRDVSVDRDGDGRSSTDRLVQKAKEAATEVLDRAQDRGERFAEKAGRATSEAVDRTVGSLDPGEDGEGVLAFVRRQQKRRPVVVLAAAVVIGVAIGRVTSR